jgi:hypothetical protein
VLAGALLSLLQAGPQAPSTSAQPRAIERELAVREWALFPERHSSELLARVKDPDWAVRAGALDAIRRGWECGEPGQHSPAMAKAALAACADPHPSVRAAALEAVAACPAESDEQGGLGGQGGLESLAFERSREVLPAVRLAWVPVLARQRRGVPSLLEACEDPDERVAKAARAALGLVAARDEAVLDSYASRALGGDGELPLALERARVSDEFIRRIGAHLETQPGDGCEPLVEVLRLRLHGRADVPKLVASWRATWGSSRRALLLRAARAGGRDLGLALLQAAAESAPQAATPFLEGAVEALDPNEVACEALQPNRLSREQQIELWDLLRGRAEAFDEARQRAWLDGEVPASLRRAVTFTIAETFARTQDAGSGAWLERALADPDREVSRMAFEALCDASEPARWLAALHGAWSSWPREEQLERLAHVPRSVACVPFRGELLAIGREERASRAAATELLGAFADDPDVARELQAWLERELSDLPSAPAESLQASELRTQGILRALERIEGDRSVPQVLAALERVRDVSVQVGKIAVGLLGKSAAGRERLPSWLEPDVPRRLRVEASLALAPEGDARALAALIEDYPFCDWELRSRALRAMQVLRDAHSQEFLAALLAREGADAVERAGAIEALALRDSVAALRALELAADAEDFEVRRAAIGALGAREPRLLLERLRRIEGSPQLGEAQLAEREALLVALGRNGELGEEVEQAFLRLPMADGERALAQRFLGQSLPAPDFAWRAELELAEAFARAEKLEAVLAHAGPWWRMDGRFLLELSRRARRAGTGDGARSSEWLGRAGLIALRGEAAVEGRAEAEFAARWELFEMAEAWGEWSSARIWADAVQRSWLAGGIDEREFVARIGAFDPRAGVDGGARVRSAALQVRARVELEQGRRAAANELAQRARAEVGASREARARQEELERALGG